MHLRWWLVPILCFAAAPLTAQDAPAKKAKAKLTLPGKPGAIELLGKQVKLVFALKGEDLPPMTVYCATTEYSASFQFDGNEGYANVHVSGQLRLMDGDQLLVVYQSLLDYEDGNGAGNFAASGSVIVKIGHEAKLMQVGGHDFVVATSLVKASDFKPSKPADDDANK